MRQHFPVFLRIVYCSVMSCGMVACTDVAPEAARTVLIRNVMIVDGSGAPAYAGALRMSGNVITETGDLHAGPHNTVIDGGGMTLAPGFIDSHSHAGEELLQLDDALAVTSQGITTVILGQDGGSYFPLADFFKSVEDKKIAVNVASYVGHNTLRSHVLGDDFRREATPDEVASMSTMLREELAAGGLGLSSGFEYDPGIYSSRAEVLTLAQVAAEAGTRYISHVRSEDRWFDDAIDEIIEKCGPDTLVSPEKTIP